MARYNLGKKNILADHLGHPGQVLPTEWTFFPLGVDAICKEYGCPHQSVHHQDKLQTSHCRSGGMKGRCFLVPVGQLKCLCLPSIHSFQTGLVESYAFMQSLHDPGSSSLATKRMICRSCGCSGGRTQTPYAVEPPGAVPCESFMGLESPHFYA